MVAAALAAIVHLTWFAVWFIGFRERLSAAKIVIVDWDPSVSMMHVRIAVALIISVAGLFSRRTGRNDSTVEYAIKPSRPDGFCNAVHVADKFNRYRSARMITLHVD